MNKQEFIACLRAKLQGLPTAEVEERLCFYSEIIDDKIEEGASEEQAVGEIGSVDEIAREIVADIPLAKIAKEKIMPKRRLKVWEIVLLALGSPVWLSLVVAAIAVILSLYASLWAVLASVWAVFASFVGGALGGTVGGVIFICQGNAPLGFATIGAGTVLAGLSVFLFFGCKAATSGTLLLTKKLGLGVKGCFVGKGENHE